VENLAGEENVLRLIQIRLATPSLKKILPAVYTTLVYQVRPYNSSFPAVSLSSTRTIKHPASSRSGGNPKLSALLIGT